MRCRLWLVLALLAVALAGCGSSRRSTLIVGLADGAAGWGGSSTAPELDRMVSLSGARWFRDVFAWNMIEPSPGKFTFAYYDHYMLLAARRRLHIVAQLVGTPAWAGPTPTSLPANPSQYARYVAAVVGRYGPGGSFWRAHPSLAGSAISTYELWNEPYFKSGDGGVYNPGRYARLVEAAAIAGHAVAPSARFLLEAEMEAHLSRTWTWWVNALYHAVPALNHYFDGVAVHAYGLDTTDLRPVVAGKPYPNYGRLRRVEDLRRQFVAHGAGDKPFWIMETGWPTCPGANGDCVSPARQAANLETLFRYVHTRWRSFVQAVFVYRFQDGPQPGTVEDTYGLVSANGKAKPALKIFREFAADAPN